MYLLDKNDNLSLNTNYLPVNYLMVPRSSMGSKTPLRQSNSIGVIDSGYRGILTGVVDNLNFNNKVYQGNNHLDNNYTINEGERLFQILSPNLSFPYYVSIINDFEDQTLRGIGGFGSSGR